MKRKSILAAVVYALLLACAVFVLGACGGGGGDAGAETDATAETDGSNAGEVYEFSGNFIPASGSPTILAYEHTKEYLAEKSGGRLIFNIFSDGQLGSSETENAEACAQNVYQVTTMATHTIAQYGGFQEYSATTIPYLFMSAEDLYTYLDSDMLSTVNDKFREKTGLRIYGGFIDGMTCIATADTPFTYPEDLKGVKIRSQESDNYVNMYNEMGISPVPMAGGEIFTAIQQGTIEGLSGIPAMVVNNRFFEVCNYLTDINAFVNCHIIVVNDSWYQSLPDDLKAIFDEGIADLLSYAEDTITGGIDKQFAACEENGMTVTRLTDEQRQRWADACKNTYAQMKEEIGSDIISQIEEMLK
jgi:TRAP-type C4-dicarboxylate transport system substrate-binding protein